MHFGRALLTVKLLSTVSTEESSGDEEEIGTVRTTHRAFFNLNDFPCIYNC